MINNGLPGGTELQEQSPVFLSRGTLPKFVPASDTLHDQFHGATLRVLFATDVPSGRSFDDR